MLPACPWRPAPAYDIVADPELAPLVLLDAALVVTLEALLAFTPELAPNALTWEELTPTVLAARQLILHARHMRLLIDDYRAKILNDDEIPF